jgi:hypothetical protein
VSGPGAELIRCHSEHSEGSGLIAAASVKAGHTCQAGAAVPYFLAGDEIDGGSPFGGHRIGGMIRQASQGVR